MIHLQTDFGKCTVREREFDHCGIAHKQLASGAVEVSQDEYRKSLRPIVISKERMS